MENGNLLEEIKDKLSVMEGEIAYLKHLVDELSRENCEQNVKGGQVSENEVPAKRVDGRLISDLRKAIGLNDRIRFQKELFGGDSCLMNSAIDALNEVSSYSEALEYIAGNFSWDDENETVKYFKGILGRKAY